MFKHLKLTRPLAVFDLETTGTNPEEDRIVEISITKIMPDGSHETRTRLINPTIKIPEEASDVHGITDAKVENEKTFKQYSKHIDMFLKDCDLCGFNLINFDLRMLRCEFKRAGIDFKLEDRVFVDPMKIFHLKEARDLTAAVKFYLNREHSSAHRAEADVQATIEILNAMYDKYNDLPDTASGLQELVKPKGAEDGDGKFKKVNGEVRLTFGKHRGRSLEWVAKNDASFLQWMINGDFLPDTKRVAREALENAKNSGKKQ